MIKHSLLATVLFCSLRLFSQGNVGIGTTTPHSTAKLHIDAGSSSSSGMLVSGIRNNAGSVPDLNAGSRLMYFPGKAAFRAGYVLGGQWNNANVGLHSTAIGYNTIASGESSTATGDETTASGDYSTAMGGSTSASGALSTAMGFAASATGPFSTAMGSSTVASGNTSTAMGEATIASGYAATAIGSGTEASGYATLAVGLNNDPLLAGAQNILTDATPIFQVGNGVSSAQRSNAFVVKANGFVGVGNDTRGGKLSVAHSSTLSSPTFLLYDNSAASAARLQFQNASGSKFWQMTGYTDNTTDGNSRLNFYYSGGSTLDVLSLSGNGNVGIGTTSPSQKLHVVGNICASGSIGSCSDIRYKTALIPLSTALSSVMHIQPIYYHWKQEYKDKGFTGERQLGFSAQEVEQYFPEIVQTDKDGYKAVDYSRMTPVLVQAVKELKAENDELKERLQKLESEMKEVLQLVKQKQ